MMNKEASHQVPHSEDYVLVVTRLGYQPKWKNNKISIKPIFSSHFYYKLYSILLVLVFLVILT